MIVKVRLSDDEYGLFKDIASMSKQPISGVIRSSSLLWVAFTTQPLIHILNSDKYSEIMNDVMAKYHNDVKK